MQEQIVRSALDGKDVLAILPTGGGKSVCFQVPGLMTDGIALVITPLIALMKDQVQNLMRHIVYPKGVPICVRIIFRSGKYERWSMPP